MSDYYAEEMLPKYQRIRELKVLRKDVDRVLVIVNNKLYDEKYNDIIDEMNIQLNRYLLEIQEEINNISKGLIKNIDI